MDFASDTCGKMRYHQQGHRGGSDVGHGVVVGLGAAVRALPPSLAGSSRMLHDENRAISSSSASAAALMQSAAVRPSPTLADGPTDRLLAFRPACDEINGRMPLQQSIVLTSAAALSLLDGSIGFFAMVSGDVKTTPSAGMKLLRCICKYLPLSNSGRQPSSPQSMPLQQMAERKSRGKISLLRILRFTAPSNPSCL